MQHTAFPRRKAEAKAVIYGNLEMLVSRVGLEPTTIRLKVECSTG